MVAAAAPVVTVLMPRASMEVAMAMPAALVAQGATLVMADLVAPVMVAAVRPGLRVKAVTGVRVETVLPERIGRVAPVRQA